MTIRVAPRHPHPLHPPSSHLMSHFLGLAGRYTSQEIPRVRQLLFLRRRAHHPAERHPGGEQRAARGALAH